MPTLTTRSVGLGELVRAQGTDDVLVAQGLGSCVGISVYDPVVKVAAMAHVMLPGPALPGMHNGADQPARFADRGVAAVVQAVEERGGQRKRLIVKLAGGAQVIRLAGREDMLKVGPRNIIAVRDACTQLGLRVAAEDLGGGTGRTLSLYAATGQTTVRVVGGAEQPL